LALARDDNALLYSRIFSQDGGNLVGFDPIATDFDLIVDSAQKFDLAVRKEADKISGPIHARAGAGIEGIGKESLGGELGMIQIAPPHSLAANE